MWDYWRFWIWLQVKSSWINVMMLLDMPTFSPIYSRIIMHLSRWALCYAVLCNWLHYGIFCLPLSIVWFTCASRKPQLLPSYYNSRVTFSATTFVSCKGLIIYKRIKFLALCFMQYKPCTEFIYRSNLQLPLSGWWYVVYPAINNTKV